MPGSRKPATTTEQVEYAAAWQAARGLKGEHYQELPDNISPAAYNAIIRDLKGFREKVAKYGHGVHKIRVPRSTGVLE